MGMIQRLFRVAALGAIASVGLLVSPSSIDLQPEKLMAHETHSPATEADPHNENHAHRVLEIPQGEAIPTVDVIVHPDAQRGWNLEIKVENFAFAPERVNESSQFSEGHAHLYVNGIKITRLYGSWYYLEALEPGQYEVTVSLNTNAHEALVYKEQPIQDTEIIEVTESGH